MNKIFFTAIIVSAITIGQAFANCNTSTEIKTADQAWATALATHNPQTAANQYAKNAVLLATYENNPITTAAGKKAYFTSLFQTLPQLQVQYDKEIIYTFPGGAVSSGLYTFSGVQKGKSVNIPARFTFVYEATANGCLLVAQHSSALPISPYK